MLRNKNTKGDSVDGDRGCSVRGPIGARKFSRTNHEDESCRNKQHQGISKGHTDIVVFGHGIRWKLKESEAGENG